MNFKQHKVVIAVASAITLGLGGTAIAASVNPSKTVDDLFESDNSSISTDRGSANYQASADKASEILKELKDGTLESVFGADVVNELKDLLGENPQVDEIIPFAVDENYTGGDQEFTMSFPTTYPEGTELAVTIGYFDPITGEFVFAVFPAVANADGSITFTVSADVMAAAATGFGWNTGAVLAVVA